METPVKIKNLANRGNNFSSLCYSVTINGPNFLLHLLFSIYFLQRNVDITIKELRKLINYMYKIIKQPVFFLSLAAVSACGLPRPEDYSRNVLQTFTSGAAESFYREILSGGDMIYQLAMAGGLFTFLYGIILFLFYRKNISSLYLGLSGLTLSLVYLSPFLNLFPLLTGNGAGILMIRTELSILYFIFLRLWAMKAFHHRKKPWIILTRISVFFLVILISALSWFNPALLSQPWAVPLAGTFVFADSSICSLLSLKRKSDRSGIGGLSFSVFFAGLTALFLFTSDSPFLLLRSLNNAFFSLPTGLLLIVLILEGIMLQREIRSQRLYLEEYKTQSQELKETIEREEKEYNRLEETMKEALQIPSFHVATARKALKINPVLPLNMPEGWEGAHFLEDSGRALPSIAAWPFSPGQSTTSDLLFMAETSPEDRYSYPALQFLLDRLDAKTKEKSNLKNLFADINRELNSLGAFPESPLSAGMLQFTEDHLICSTAGSALVWYKKPGEKLQLVSTKEIPATFQQGLGFKPYSRETGRPFRIPVATGDMILITSRSFLFREQSMNGQIYGKDSLQRVVENHESGSADSLLSSLIKDFDDFDMGNTRDRRLYAGIFKKK